MTMQLFKSWIVLVIFSTLAGAEPVHNAIESHLIPPELLMQHRDVLGLSKQQQDEIRRLAEQTGRQAAEHQRSVEQTTHALARLLATHPIDEPAAIQQLDKLLKTEEIVKRLHLQFMIRVKNQLTAEQLELIGPLRQQTPPHDLERRLRAKLTRVEREVRRRSDAGDPPFEAVKLMQTFQQEMQAGRPLQAERILDDVIKKLGLEQGEPADDSKQSFAPPPADRKPHVVPALPKLSRDDVEKQIAALMVEDVPWRKIDWKPCLLDGLQASRAQQKPVLLWIFIDRPIDDERC